MGLLLRNEGKVWYEVPCCCFLVDVHCGFRVGSGWLLLFPGGLWMVGVICWCPLCYAFALHAAHRKPSLQPVFDVHSIIQRILKIEGEIWYEGGLRNLSKSIFSPPNPPPPPVTKMAPPDVPCGFVLSHDGQFGLEGVGGGGGDPPLLLWCTGILIPPVSGGCGTDKTGGRRTG